MYKLLFTLLLPTVIEAEFAVVGPITSHFNTWLNNNGYADDNFARQDYGTQGSYGGKTSDDQKLMHTPIVFIHGNSDAALRQGYGFEAMSGWENSIDYFEKKGYTSAELYATSWGDTNPLHGSTRTHDCQTTIRLRHFLVAVQNYTGADKVHLITHSMGVTLGRKIIKGGKISSTDGTCDLGTPLHFVDVFVGLAGANYGVCNCEGLGVEEPTCNKQNGLWPGDSCGLNYLDCGLTVLPFSCSGPTYSQFLTDLNNDFTQEAKRLVSAWSTSDDLILYGDYVWGKPTSLIPRSTDQKTYLTYTHMQTKEQTYEDQYNWVNRIN